MPQIDTIESEADTAVATVEEAAPAPEIYIEDPAEVETVGGDRRDVRWWMPVVFLILALLFFLIGRFRPDWIRGGWTAAALVFLALGLWFGAVILAQDAGGDEGAGSTRTRTRNGECLLEAEFGLRVMGPRPSGRERDVLFTQLHPGLSRMDSNGNLLVKVKDVRVAPYPGTITFVVRRGPAGTDEVVRISKRVTNDAELAAFIAGTPPPRLGAPPGMNANDARRTERLRAEVDYDPEDTTDDCPPIREELTITWHYNGAPRDFHWEPVQRPAASIDVPKERSRVVIGPGIVDETTGFPGEVNKATRVTVFFQVDEPFSCCGDANRHHAVIQFVRHRWQRGARPDTIDAWNLDGPESQSDRHAGGDEYDPTYTTDPAHGQSTEGRDNVLVHVGPWDASGGGAVIVDDFPGLLQPDHERYLREGGYVEWEFVTLLVCREDHGSAAHYLANGKVRARTHFRIRRTYPGNGADPTLSSVLRGGPQGRPEYFEPCRDLAELLRESRLLQAFENPRTHRLPL